MSDPIYLQSTLAQVRAVDGTSISYPFIEDGDNSKVYNMACTQTREDYNASQVALDTPMTSAAAAGVIELPFPADANAYFVGDTGHSPLSGGMISFTRTFANIPQTITRPTGSEFFTFPGIEDASFAPSGVVNISSIQMVPNVAGITCITSSAHGLATGDWVFINMSYTVGTDTFRHQIVGYYQVEFSLNPTIFRVDVGHYWNTYVDLNLIEGNTIRSKPSRSPTSVNVATHTRYDYILPGVTTPWVTSSTDVNMPTTFQPVNIDTGEPTQTLITDTGVPQTSPTVDEYLDMMKNENNIIIESSLSRWAGNILVIQTKTCKAR